MKNRKLIRLHKKVGKLLAEIENIVQDCNHIIVKDGDSAVCEECGKNFGWWCPNSPNHYCDYPLISDGYNEDICRFCGEPDERE